LSIGPLVVPFSVLLAAAAIVAAVLVGWRAGRQAPAEVDRLLWQSILAGLLVARLAFVWQFRDQYLATPLTILDIRDGGFTPLAAAAGAALFALLRQWRRPQVRRGVWAGLAAGAMVWALGALALALVARENEQLPPLALVSLDGQPVNLSAYQGKPVVVNLWATWCPPCVREMPVLQQAQAARPSVHFVFINVREPAPRVRAWLQSRQLLLRNVLLDEAGDAAAQVGAPGLPTTLFFDASGHLASTRVGELSAATLQQRLEAISR